MNDGFEGPRISPTSPLFFPLLYFYAKKFEGEGKPVLSKMPMPLEPGLSFIYPGFLNAAAHFNARRHSWHFDWLLYEALEGDRAA